MIDYRKCPWPWFGGKADAAPAVWQSLGDVEHYVEPFAGSLAVLLRRPHQSNRAYYSETVADTDSLLCNFWRAVQWFPNETAEAASWPVSEIDKHARGSFILAWRESEATARLAGDPYWCDPLIAGWWAWCVCVSIGAWGHGGPWWPDADGVLRKRDDEQDGVTADRPDISGGGRGVNHPGTREPGVSADLPHISGDGQGVTHAGTREPRVGLDERIAADYAATCGYHPLTMPELRRWLCFLSARLRHVRIVNGDWTGAVNGSWKRVCTSGAAETLTVRMDKGRVGFFLDPPYGVSDRDAVYGKQESFTVAAEVRAWCLAKGDDPKYRIVYAGFDTEGEELVAAGWREVEWFRAGHLKGGMGNSKKNKPDGDAGHQQHRERLWNSPHCLFAADPQQRFCGME